MATPNKNYGLKNTVIYLIVSGTNNLQFALKII